MAEDSLPVGWCVSCSQQHGDGSYDVYARPECVPLKWRTFNKNRVTGENKCSGHECYHCWDYRRLRGKGLSQAQLDDARKEDPELDNDFKYHRTEKAKV